MRPCKIPIMQMANACACQVCHNTVEVKDLRCTSSQILQRSKAQFLFPP